MSKVYRRLPKMVPRIETMLASVTYASIVLRCLFYDCTCRCNRGCIQPARCGSRGAVYYLRYAGGNIFFRVCMCICLCVCSGGHFAIYMPKGFRCPSHLIIVYVNCDIWYQTFIGLSKLQFMHEIGQLYIYVMFHILRCSFSCKIWCHAYRVECYKKVHYGESPPLTTCNGPQIS